MYTATDNQTAKMIPFYRTFYKPEEFWHMAQDQALLISRNT